MRASQAPESQSLVPGVPAPRVLDCGGEPCDAVVRGFLAFFDRRLHGLGANGRACADCHMATDNFQLSPASAEARFQLLERRRQRNPNADDPLFRPIDADDFRTNGESASDFSNLRENGLVRISFPLPSNIKLIDPATNAPSAETFVDIWRSVPTVNDVALTGPDDGNPWPRGPNQSGGYQLDARVGTLQEQALGALTNHAKIQNAPPQRLLDDLASFQRVLFTNHRVRALSDAVSAGTIPLPDPDPPLNELEEQGKVVFVRACAHCHGGPRQSTPQAPVNRFHRIHSQCPRPVDTVTPARFAFAACPPRLARNARTYEIALSVPTPSPTGCFLPGPRFAGRAPIRVAPFRPGSWVALRPRTIGRNSTCPHFAGFARPLRTSTTTARPRSRTSSITTSSSSSASRRIGAGCHRPPFATTDGMNFDRQPSPEERAALLAYLRKL